MERAAPPEPPAALAATPRRRSHQASRHVRQVDLVAEGVPVGRGSITRAVSPLPRTVRGGTALSGRHSVRSQREENVFRFFDDSETLGGEGFRKKAAMKGRKRRLVGCSASTDPLAPALARCSQSTLHPLIASLHVHPPTGQYRPGGQPDLREDLLCWGRTGSELLHLEEVFFRKPSPPRVCEFPKKRTRFDRCPERCLPFPRGPGASTTSCPPGAPRGCRGLWRPRPSPPS
jgi:hypothetical protein